jgi:hypothetical protein
MKKEMKKERGAGKCARAAGALFDDLEGDVILSVFKILTIPHRNVNQKAILAG